MVKNILLTSDDGYDSLGVRLLIAALKDHYTLKIAATKTQQSGVGGKIHLAEGGQWGRDTVGGIEAVWVDRAPVDAIHLARTLWGQEHIDLVISGINMGSNIGGAGLISSGTFSAAFRALGIKLAPRGIAMSWESPADMWMAHDNHTKTHAEDLAAWLVPAAKELVSQAIQDDFWGASMLNINFPSQATTKAVFTMPLPDAGDYYDAVLRLDEAKGTFKYPFEEVNGKDLDASLDAGAIRAGQISITPCRSDMLDLEVYTASKNRSLNLG